jgi:hypothetical protein
MAAVIAPRMGAATQVPAILPSTAMSVTDPVKRFQPTMAPTMAWVVETGRPDFVIR